MNLENNIYKNKYIKYKQKYLTLKNQQGGEINNSLFYYVNINELTPEHREALKIKFETETEIAELFTDFYSDMAKILKLFDKKSDEVISYTEITNFEQYLSSQFVFKSKSFTTYFDFITYIKKLGYIQNNTDLISELKKEVDSIEINDQDLNNVWQTVFKINKLITNLKSNINGYLLGHFKNTRQINKNLFDLMKINPLETLKEILVIYKNKYNYLVKSPKNLETNIQLVDPEILSLECVFTKICKTYENIKTKIQMFKSMGEATLKYYESNLFYTKPINMDRYLISYNDLIYMFVNTGKPDGITTVSEHIFITKTPSDFISNLYHNKDERAVSVKLHLYALKLFKPNYIYSHPLDIMSDIFATNFVKKGLFTKTDKKLNPGDIFGKDYKELQFGIDPTVEYAVNHQVLDQMLTEHGLA